MKSLPTKLQAYLTRLGGFREGILRAFVLKDCQYPTSCSFFSSFNFLMKSRNRYLTTPSKIICKTSTGAFLHPSKPVQSEEDQLDRVGNHHIKKAPFNSKKGLKILFPLFSGSMRSRGRLCCMSSGIT